MHASSALRRVCAAVLGAFTAICLCNMPLVQAKSKKPTPPPVKRRPLEKVDVYVPSVLQWQRPPGAAVPGDWSSARAEVNVAIFYPWGDFVGGKVNVRRTAEGGLEVVPDEDYSMRKGTWTRDGKDILVQSHWIKYEKSDTSKKKKKPKDFKESWTTDPKIDKTLAHYIVIGATEYVQADALQNPEALEKMFQ